MQGTVMTWSGGLVLPPACCTSIMHSAAWRLGIASLTHFARDLLSIMEGIEDFEQAWHFAPELLIWVLSVGTMLTPNRPQYKWFVDTLAAACSAFGYEEWTQYREAIQSFLWVERYDDQRYFS